MSATTAAGTPALRRERPPRVTQGVQALVLAVVALDAAILAGGVFAVYNDFVLAGWPLVAWIAAVAVVGAVSLSFESGSQLGLDMPLLLAAGFIYGPIVAGTIAVIGYVDPREFKRDVPLLRAAFNRAQTSLCVMAATVVYEGVVNEAEDWPLVVLGAALAVGIDGVLNYGLVVAAVSLSERLRYSVALSRLHFGTPLEFAGTWAAFGLLSLMLAEVYRSSGAWALAIFAVPLLLARQSLVASRRLDWAASRLAVQSQALRDVEAIIADERRDERLSLAAGLHDEVLPPIYQVHLMGQVLRQDLDTGQLLALEEDLPALLRAADGASESTRAFIGGLRNSPLGTAGLAETLRLLVEYLRQESGMQIVLRTVNDIRGTPLAQLLAYQAAREAIRNAVKHSRAGAIWVWLAGDDKEIRIVVEDDGVGFVPGAIDRSRHFGLDLSRERVELAGGQLQVESERGMGTRLTIQLPSGVLFEG